MLSPDESARISQSLSNLVVEPLPMIDWLAPGFIYSIVKDIWAALRRRVTRIKPSVPRVTVRAIPILRDLWWHLGSHDGAPAMQIATRWLITNISERPTIVAMASMSRGWFRAGHQADVITRNVIPVGATVKTMIDFWIHPPFRNTGESFKTRITFFDHLGNPHKTQRITIPSDWRPKREELKPTEEAIHSITDPLVKRVVAILKDEVNRYKECGRRLGGLGSVQVTYENRTLKGIGYQGRQANSPRRQWIVPDPETASIHSDSLCAITKIFENEDIAGKQMIINGLLERINIKSEYTCITYFILFSLFKIGQLPAALRTIKDKLLGDKTYGLDDSIRMLSGLLQYEHPSFDDYTLDEVERFMDGLNGFVHHLKERCIAARAVKLQAKESGASAGTPT